jgi:hypothetical protein
MKRQAWEADCHDRPVDGAIAHGDCSRRSGEKRSARGERKTDRYKQALHPAKEHGKPGHPEQQNYGSAGNLNGRNIHPIASALSVSVKLRYILFTSPSKKSLHYNTKTPLDEEFSPMISPNARTG